MKGKSTAVALTVGLVGTLGISWPTAAPAAIPATISHSAAPSTVQAPTLAARTAVKKFKNCKALNQKYAHGVGKTGARDKVSGRGEPVTNFKKSSALYQKNKHLDRDKDGVACEKH